MRRHEKTALKAYLRLQMAVSWMRPDLLLTVLMGEAVQLKTASKLDFLCEWMRFLVPLLEEELARYRLS